jgi:phenylpropionate dioxygenase-like ring-hydroxylating dioxygenase large terminal subunit
MDYRFPFPPYPNGWFAIGFASDFPTGAVVTRRHFGQDLIVYRTGGGALHVTDPHCPHVGAHLGHGGRVVGDHLRCPFHGWCFDGDGQCVEIPGTDRIPPRAQLRTWPARETNGVVFVHYHEAGAAPTWEPPLLPDDGWSHNRTVLWTLRTHPQEVFENIVDSAHLAPLHGCQAGSIERDPVEDGHSFNIVLKLVADGAIVGMPGITNEVILDVTMYGLGNAIVKTHVLNAGIHARQRIYCTPIDEQRIEIRGVVNLRALDDPLVTEQVAELFYQAYVVDFAMDFPIWENKVYRERPILSAADGPFMAYRKWARSFYSDPESARLRSLPVAARSL